MLEESSVIYLLWLIEALKPANSKINRLLSAFALPENVYFAPIDEVGKAADLSPDDINALEKGRDLTSAQSILDKCKKEDISICTIYDNNYPERFQNIPNPPTLFFYKGTPIWDDAPLNIAIVGTRKMTKYGYTMHLTEKEKLGKKQETKTQDIASYKKHSLDLDWLIGFR